GFWFPRPTRGPPGGGRSNAAREFESRRRRWLQPSTNATSGCRHGRRARAPRWLERLAKSNVKAIRPRELSGNRGRIGRRMLVFENKKFARVFEDGSGHKNQQITRRIDLGPPAKQRANERDVAEDRDGLDDGLARAFEHATH